MLEGWRSVWVRDSLRGALIARLLTAFALIGLGVERLSITPAAVGPIKAMIRSLDVSALRSAYSELVVASGPPPRNRLGDWAVQNGVEL